MHCSSWMFNGEFIASLPLSLAVMSSDSAINRLHFDSLFIISTKQATVHLIQVFLDHPVFTLAQNADRNRKCMDCSTRAAFKIVRMLYLSCVHFKALKLLFTFTYPANALTCVLLLQVISSKDAWLPGQPSVIIPRPQLTADAVAGVGYGGPAATDRQSSRPRRSPYQPAVGAPVSYQYHASDAGRPPVTSYRI